MNLNQITVSTIDMPRSIRFYEALGLKLIVNSSNQYARFVCPDGQSTFSLSLVEEVTNTSDVHIYFECENLDEVVEQLKEKGLKFDEEPTDKRWLWREAHLTDPDGHPIILFYGGENRINPPWKLK